MKLTPYVKINIFIILITMVKYLPLEINIQYQDIPDFFSLFMYTSHLLKKKV